MRGLTIAESRALYWLSVVKAYKSRKKACDCATCKAVEMFIPKER